jgi:uncharacterized protein
MIKNKITKTKIEKYYNLTSKALKIAEKSVPSKNKKQAQEIFTMVKCYLDDSQHFQKNGDFVNSYGALNYAHGWLDAGARLKVYNVTDNKLFTI